MRHILIASGVALVGVAAVAILACDTKEQATESAALIQAPDFTLMDQYDNPVNLSDYCGKIVVLEWTNPRCPFVQRHYTEGTMLNLACKYAGEGVAWLSIQSNNFGTVELNRKWAEERNIPYPILDDRSGVVGKAYGAKTSPHMFIIDTDGVIVYQGAIDNDIKGDKENRVNYVDQALTELLSCDTVDVPRTTPYGCTVKYAR